MSKKARLAEVFRLFSLTKCFNQYVRDPAQKELMEKYKADLNIKDLRSFSKSANPEISEMAKSRLKAMSVS